MLLSGLRLRQKHNKYITTHSDDRRLDSLFWLLKLGHYHHVLSLDHHATVDTRPDTRCARHKSLAFWLPTVGNSPSLALAAASSRVLGGVACNSTAQKTRMAAPVSFSRWLGCGFALALIENTPVLLTRPLLESMPLHLWEITAQVLDVRGIPCNIEPLEHQSHIFALGT